MNVAVLFDLEDTLVKTPWSVHQHVLKFRRDTRRKLIELGIPKTVLEKINRATIMRNIASEYVQRHFSEARARIYRREMETFLNHYELDSAKKSRLFAETISTLQTLRELGAKIGLVTNTSRRAVDVVFEIHGLKAYFDVVVTREDVAKLKPDPEGVLLAARKLRVKRFLFVGDLVLDILAAKGANGVAIMVTRDLEKSDSQDLFRSLPEILRENKGAPEKGEPFMRTMLSSPYVRFQQSFKRKKGEADADLGGNRSCELWQLTGIAVRGASQAFYSQTFQVAHVEVNVLKAYILMSTEASELWSVAEAALRIEGVKTADAVTGQFDAIALVDFPKMDDLGRVIEKIRRLKGVIRTQSLIAIPPPVRE